MNNQARYNNTNDKSKRERFFLTCDAADFIKNVNIDKINLYLCQNRYCCEVWDEKRKRTSLQPLLMCLLNEHPVSFNKLNMQALLEKQITRNKELAASFQIYEEYKAVFPGRMILGEGGNTPYSQIVPMKLHPLYGVPYLPASAIKGLFRDCWNTLYAEQEDNTDDGDKMEDLLFGTAEENKREGKLIFFDAFPESFTLTLDVETPHYPDYYTKNKKPTDDQNPLPIKIICMENVKLPVQVACADRELWERQQQKMKKVFQQMVEINGVGAKTSLGYGIGRVEWASLKKEPQRCEP